VDLITFSLIIHANVSMDNRSKHKLIKIV